MVKRKKIIFILTFLGPGGAEKVVSIIANNLPRKLYEPKVILFSNDPKYSNMLSKDVEVLITGTDRIRNSLVPILRILRKEQPDIVFASYGELNAYISLFIKLFPTTKFIARETNVVSNHVTRKEIKFFYRFYNNYHKIICQSTDMYDDLNQNFGIDKTKLVKINNPVDFQLIDSKLLNHPKPDVYIDGFKHVVAVGNLAARKGFDNLLKVFTRLKSDRIMLHILGGGRDEEMLHQMKEMLGLKNVFFHGKQENPYPFLKFADLFVLSSRYEGFPNVLLEAGACGTYSVANNCPGGISEIIIEGVNGEKGVIENYDEFAQLISKNVHAITDKKEIRKSIEFRFSKEIILKDYQKALENIFI